MNLEQYKAYIEATPLDEATRKNLLLVVEPCFKFRDFLKEKHKISADEVETLIQLQIAGKRDEIYKGISDLEHEDFKIIVINRMVEVMTEFAKKEDYENVEEFTLAIETLLLLSVQEYDRVKQVLN